MTKTQILAIVDLPMATFQPNTSTKTSVIFLKKQHNPSLNYDLFMAVANCCGHNRRGKAIEQDDLPFVLQSYKQYQKGALQPNDYAFIVNVADLKRTNFWIPKHFYPYYQKILNQFKQQYATVLLGSIVTIKKGDEAGSENYIPFIDRELCDVPFLRTGDLVNYSVNQFADIFLEEQFFIDLNQDLQPNDILHTKDGKIGITAMLTEDDKVIIASGIVRIRLNKEAKEQYGFTQKYIFAILSDKFMGYFQALQRTVVAATIPHLCEQRLAEFEIPIMPAKKIAEVTQIVKQTFALKNQSKLLDKQIANYFNLKRNISYIFK